MVLVTALIAIAPHAGAQEERPQIDPGERKIPRKKDAGPRAIGVVQLTPEGKASLVPIAILVNGKFWDASAYKADPVPMALDSGVVYEAERSGSSLGLFTVNNALHSNSVNVPNPWIATGAWHPNGTQEPTKANKAESAPVGMDTSNGPPRLTHDPAKQNQPATPAPAAPSSSTPPSESKSSGGSGDEPPRLTKPAGPSTSSPPPSGTSAPAPAPADPAKAPSVKVDAKANIPASDSGTAEANRPVLRRGRPAQSFADEEVPGYSKPGAASIPAAASKAVNAAAPKSDVQVIPAISDAGGPTPHSFIFDWVKGDEEDRRKQMTDAAKQQLRDYVGARSKNTITAKPAQAAHRPAAKLPEPILENVQMVAYDLWNTNQAVMVLSATAHMPPSPASSQGNIDPDVQYSILLVAFPDMYNNLHKLYAGVTDKFHLDVTPRLELVDAVDADGDGRGELLFRVTSDAGIGWAIYRATGDKLYKRFDSLNPE